MGYSASNYHGHPFVVSDPTAVLDALPTRVSWCGNTAHYRATCSDDATALVEILNNYGFESTLDDTNPNQVIVECWGGDKLGSSWDDMWNALATGVTCEVQWIMIGEDNDMWAEIIANGSRSWAGVEVVIR